MRRGSPLYAPRLLLAAALLFQIGCGADQAVETGPTLVGANGGGGGQLDGAATDGGSASGSDGSGADAAQLGDDVGVAADAGAAEDGSLADGALANDGGGVATPDVSAPKDAAAPDADNADSGSADSGSADTGKADSETPDAGKNDAGTPDASKADAGTSDAGTFDTGTSDAGSADAGKADVATPDAGKADAGSADAGQADAGTPDAVAADAGPPPPVCTGPTCIYGQIAQCKADGSGYEKPQPCPAAGPCTTGLCKASQCTTTPKNGACSDGSACTTGEACSGGACTGGQPTTCDDGNACTDDTCDAKLGCVFKPNNKTCDDGDACTSGEVCGNGKCVGGKPKSCDDGVACTVDSCVAGTCKHTNNGSCCPTKLLAEHFDAGGTPADWYLYGYNSAVKWRIRLDADYHKSGKGAAHYGTTGQEDYKYKYGYARAHLTTAKFKVPSTGNPTLTFWLWFDLEDDGKKHDKLWLEGRAGDISLYSPVVKNLRAGRKTKQWHFVKVPLGKYAGKGVRLRFVFDPVDKKDNDGKGVYIDDVVLKVDGCPAGTAP